MMKNPLIYLATPYTFYRHGIDDAWRDACELASYLMIAGHSVYSPIVHSHPISEVSSLDPMDGKLWERFNAPMLAAADILVVAHLDDWDRSAGIAHEISVFEAAGKPIVHLTFPISTILSDLDKTIAAWAVTKQENTP